MNGIEKITGRIEADMQREIEAIQADARSQADVIAARYDEQAKRESEDILARGRRSADERVERLASVAQLEARKLELAAKQELLGEAFDAAVEQLCSLPREDYLALIAALAAEAAEGNEKMLLNRHDAEELGAEAILMANTALCAAGKPGKLTLGSETRPIPGGFILSCGDVELNCAFDTLVRLQREKLEKEVAAILFPVQ